MSVPLIRPWHARFLAALLLTLASASPAFSQPTPGFVWNNFISSGTQWATAANWVPGVATSGTDTVLGFSNSTLQTGVGYTTTNAPARST